MKNNKALLLTLSRIYKSPPQISQIKSQQLVRLLNIRCTARPGRTVFLLGVLVSFLPDYWLAFIGYSRKIELYLRNERHGSAYMHGVHVVPKSWIDNSLV